MDSFIHKFLYEVEHPLSSAVLGFEGDKVYGFCSQVPYICSYLIPEKVRQTPAIKTEATFIRRGPLGCLGRPIRPAPPSVSRTGVTG